MDESVLTEHYNEGITRKDDAATASLDEAVSFRPIAVILPKKLKSNRFVKPVRKSAAMTPALAEVAKSSSTAVVKRHVAWCKP